MQPNCPNFSIVWTVSICYMLSFQRKVYFFYEFHILAQPRKKCRTPAECYIYRKRYAHILALQRSAMCSDPTYRSAGAEMSVDNAAINILLRWSKEDFHFMRCVLI